MSKKFLLLLIMFILCAAVVFAGGRREQNEARESEDPFGFTDAFDTTYRRPGRWNFYIEAEDKAGNITREGPYNITVDPASDLPQVTIINPIPNMHVQGNLNLVGIAVDDDAVGSVWLTVTRGRDGRGEELVRVQAEGTDYWSFFLDTTDTEIWTDGEYTVTAWAVDINGLSGISEEFHPRVHRMHSVFWHLDRRKPETVVTSHEVGALVSGRIRLSGSVNDGNGISALHISTDGGNRFSPVSIRRDRRSGDVTFDVNLNTNVFEDGAEVIWFRAIDGQGSVGNAAHLLFVNNTGPQVEIVYPAPGTIVNGIFNIAGFASHPVGISSVSWRAGRNTGDFELIPGNPWWSAQVDIRGERGSNIDIEIRAVDVSGNVTVARQRYRVDQGADLPVVSLLRPAAGVFLAPGEPLVVVGSARDNDAVSSIFYSLNGGPAVEVPSSGHFQFLVPQLNEGANTLEVWACDIHGTLGPRAVVRNITVPHAQAEIGISTVTFGTGGGAVVREFYTGIPVVLEHRLRVAFEVTVTAPAVTSASIQFGQMPAAAIRPSGRDGLLRANVVIPAGLPDGLTRIRLSASDRFGRETVHYEYMYIENAVPAAAAAAVLAMDDFALAPPSLNFSFIRENIMDGRIFIGSPYEVLMGLGSEPLLGAVVSVSGAGSANISAAADEAGRVIVRALSQGNFGPFTLNIQMPDGRSVTSDTFNIFADFDGPSVTLNEVPAGSWLQNTVTAAFNVSSFNRIRSVEYSVDMGETWVSLFTPAQLNALPSPVNSNITRELNISEVEDGLVTLLIRAVNEADREDVQSFSVLKDTRPPAASLVMPVEDARVNGTIRLAFAFEEAGAIQSIVYNRPARPGAAAITRQVFNADEHEGELFRFIEVLMDSIEMPLDEFKSFVFTDKSGNSSEVGVSTLGQWPFIIDHQMDIPVAYIVLPLENEVITTDFIVSGVMFDDDSIEHIEWRINQGAWNTLEAEHGFSIPIALSMLTDGYHNVSVVAQDIFGVRSEPVVSGFRVSLSEPEAEIVRPSFDAVLRDTVEITGSSFDANGIREVLISVDNGNTFNMARGRENWSYSFNSTILADGPHVVFIRVMDNFDIPAVYAAMINIDNTPPSIHIDAPLDGSYSIGSLSVMGRVEDPNIESVRIEMRGLDGQTVRADLRVRGQDAVEILRDVIDLTGQPDGLYNIEVVALDRAGNVSRVSRNFQLAREAFRNTVEILYPLDNELKRGSFNLYGIASGVDPAGSVTLRVNGFDVITTAVETTGFFRFSLNHEHIQDGPNEIMVHSNFGGLQRIDSGTQTLIYSRSGPWVVIDTFNFGDFAHNRPFLEGRAGYTLSEEDAELLADRSTDRQTRGEIQERALDFTEISFDNGQTFRRTNRARGRYVDFRYRLETTEMPEGLHYVLVRAVMRNGETAVTRMKVQVDQTPPVIRLISPQSGGVFNQEIPFTASATDDVELVSLRYHLRVGDLAAYQVPGFLQGLFFDVTIPPFIQQIGASAGNPNNVPNFMGGATYMDIGIGLSFFDDNVKIMGLYGFMTQSIWESMGGRAAEPGMPITVRYGGHVLGLKLLANIYHLPFRRILGPDFEWLSATFAVGANFSLFDVAQQGYTQSGRSTWMSALLFQIEFPRVTIPNRRNFRTFSLFTEGQLWFVPTDVDADALGIDTILPKVILGFRTYVF